MWTVGRYFWQLPWLPHAKQLAAADYAFGALQTALWVKTFNHYVFLVA
jgi:hypothetical protein